MIGVPRIYEKLVSAARARREAGDRNALRTVLGGRIRWCSGGGAALSPEIERFFVEADVPIYQGYGLTETSPVISMSSDGHTRRGSSGAPIDGIEVKIAPDGEILSRGPHIMKGYWNKPQATAEAINSEGWFHTGDVGRLDDDGFLFITDRKKDIFVSSYGKNIAPQLIEGLLEFDAFIEHACIYGDGKKYLTALVVPAKPKLLEWAAEEAFPAGPEPGGAREAAGGPRTGRRADRRRAGEPGALRADQGLRPARRTLQRRRRNPDLHGEAAPEAVHRAAPGGAGGFV